MTEEERLELERLRAAGQRAEDNYQAMLNAPSNKVNIPSFGREAPGIIPAAPPMPTVDQAAPAMSQPFGFAPTEPLTPTERANLLGSQELDNAINSGNLTESGVVEIVASQSLTQGEQADLTEGLVLGALRQDGARNLSEALNVPMPMTNVGLMGEPLREQPSVDDIIFMSRPDRLASQELQNKTRGFFEGLKGIFTDPFALKLREAERYAPRNQPLDIVPSGNTMRPDTPMLDSVMESGIGPFQPGAVDFSGAATTAPTGEPIELAPLTRTATPPEATFLRADGSIGEIFPGQRIGDAFPGNPDTPSLGGQVQGVDLPGGVGFVRAPEGMVKSIGPDGRMIFTTPEQANAMAPRVSARAVTAPTTAPGAEGSATAGAGAAGAAAAVGVGAEGSATAGGSDGFTAPTRTGSRAGRFFDDVKGFFREGISGGGGLVEYFTNPNSPTLESIFERRKEFLESAREADDRARTGSVPLGEVGSIQRNFADRMATGQPLTQAETAAAIQFARSRGLNFDPRTGYSQAPMARGPQVMATAPRMMTAEFRDANGDGIEDRTGELRGGPLGPVMLPRGSGANLPTLSSVNAMAGMAPQNRPALSAYEQASMDREARMAARPDFNEAISDRDRRAARGEGLSQADARDLAQGSARGATKGERARALQIQSRLGMGAFRPGTPRVDKLSQATSTVDRMIQNGQLSPEKRNAAIQRIMGLGDVGGLGTSADAGVIGSAEFDRISAQLQPGGSLYEQGIRVDPSRIDPSTGAALIYREDDGGYLGFSSDEPVSAELIQQLLPYARAVRRPNTGDFARMGMEVNQFAGSR